MRYRKRPVEVRATRWFVNGDHPGDLVDEVVLDDKGAHLRTEGLVVRYYQRPDGNDAEKCKCGLAYFDHGWIDTLEGGFIVCPGDWIVTGVEGEMYPCKDRIFVLTYEPVEE